jgi:ribosomal protein L14
MHTQHRCTVWVKMARGKNSSTKDLVYAIMVRSSSPYTRHAALLYIILFFGPANANVINGVDNKLHTCTAYFISSN